MSRTRLKTKQSVVSVEIGEQLERWQGRVRALPPVSDRSSEMAVGPVRRIARTQQEACGRWAAASEFFVAPVRPHMRVVRPGAQAAVSGGRAEA